MTAVHVERILLSEIRIPFKTTFRHASAERSATSSIWVEATADGVTGFGESCPRPYVTGESIHSARAFFDEHHDSLREVVVDLESLRQWMAAHAEAIEQNPAAWCAAELALLDLFARSAGRTVESLLSLPELVGPFRYTAVLGDAGEAAFAATAQAYRRMGFTDFKVKLSGDMARDRAKLAALDGGESSAIRVRVDANNLWSSAGVAVGYLRDLGRPLVGIEEPLASRDYSELGEVSAAFDCPIILDESFVSAAQFPLLERVPGTWVINVRVSKMGGLLRSLAVVAGARARGVPVIVGAQVGETSLLTRAALTVAQAAGPDLLGQEGAFGTFLLEHDVCEPPLMFGAGGTLDPRAYSSLSTPGFGLQILPRTPRR
jgi:L-alanine-DL-glutamate epimerase-like enolase superfamily enzyme